MFIDSNSMENPRSVHSIENRNSVHSKETETKEIKSLESNY